MTFVTPVDDLTARLRNPARWVFHHPVRGLMCAVRKTFYRLTAV